MLPKCRNASENRNGSEARNAFAMIPKFRNVYEILVARGGLSRNSKRVNQKRPLIYSYIAKQKTYF